MGTVVVSRNPAERFAMLVHEALADGGLVALSGGSTILELLAALASELPTTGTIAQVDERLVPPGSDEANWTHLASALEGRGPRLLAMVDPSALDDADRAVLALEDPVGLEALASRLAARYAELLEATTPWRLVHLGIGPDGHTASLFPSSSGLRTAGLVAHTVDPSGRNPHHRLSLTLEALHRFERQVVVALGAAKAPIVARALRGDDLPIVAATRPDTIWLLDEAAANALDPATVRFEG